jgi:hypothetical protein
MLPLSLSSQSSLAAKVAVVAAQGSIYFPPKISYATPTRDFGAVGIHWVEVNKTRKSSIHQLTLQVLHIKATHDLRQLSMDGEKEMEKNWDSENEIALGVGKGNKSGTEPRCGCRRYACAWCE